MKPFAWQLPEKNTDDLPPLPASALRRFRSALSASVLLAKNRPVHVRTANISGPVRAEKGPYLASGNWWDENAWDRAEWDVELETGALCRCHASGRQWALDGIYD
jgi:protein ImuB